MSYAMMEMRPRPRCRRWYIPPFPPWGVHRRLVRLRCWWRALRCLEPQSEAERYLREDYVPLGVITSWASRQAQE